MELKFRAWIKVAQSFASWEKIKEKKNLHRLIDNPEYLLQQFTGLTDKNGIDYYLGDIGEFSNGDKFYLAMEGWLEVYIEWIGQPECYDQGRDLYRIVNAKIIGNIHQHSHLLEGENNHE